MSKDYKKTNEKYFENDFEFQRVPISILYINGVPIKYWLDEISNGATNLRLDDNEFISTVMCDTPDDIIKWLTYLDGLFGAQEIEL